MFKRLIYLSFLLSLAPISLVFGQTTSITAIVTDSDGTVWTLPQWKVQFYPNPNQSNPCIYQLSGQSLCSNTWKSYLNQLGTGDPTTGNMSFTLLDNTQISPSGSKWVITIQSDTSAPATQYSPLTISGSSMNLSTFLSINSEVPRIKLGNVVGLFAYTDTELTNQTPGNYYWNVSLAQSRQWQCSGGSCAWGTLTTNTWNGGSINNPIKTTNWYSNDNCVNVSSNSCGAVGDGITDDTAAINACTNYARTHNIGCVKFNCNSYKITAPLNFTISTWPQGGLWAEGCQRGQPTTSGNNNTSILDALSAAGPVFDFGGDTNGGIENLNIVGQTGTHSTSAILCDQGSTGNSEGCQGFQIRNVLIGGSGDCLGCASIALPGVDEETIDTVTVDNGIVTGWTLGKSTNVNSTFYTLTSFLPNFNTTRVNISNSHLGGDFVPAIQGTGSADYFLNNDYIALTHGGTALIGLELSEPTSGGVPNNSVHATSLRCENQSSATGMKCVVFGSRSLSGDIDGSLCPDSTGYVWATETAPQEATIAIENYKWNNNCNTGNEVNIGSNAQINNVGIYFGSGVTNLGTINSSSAWSGDNFYLSSGSSLSPTGIAAALPTSTQACIYKIGNNPYCVGNYTNPGVYTWSGSNTWTGSEELNGGTMTMINTSFLLDSGNFLFNGSNIVYQPQNTATSLTNYSNFSQPQIQYSFWNGTAAATGYCNGWYLNVGTGTNPNVGLRMNCDNHGTSNTYLDFSSNSFFLGMLIPNLSTDPTTLLKSSTWYNTAASQFRGTLDGSIVSNFITVPIANTPYSNSTFACTTGQHVAGLNIVNGVIVAAPTCN